MRFFTSLSILIILIATVGMAGPKLEDYKLCYQRAVSLEKLVRAKAISNCLNAILSKCRAASAPKICFNTIEQAADTEAQILSVSLQASFQNILIDNQDIAAKLSRMDKSLGLRVCDDGNPSCDAMSAIVIYKGFLEISSELHDLDGDI